MGLLIFGVLLFAVVHLIPAIFRPLRASLVDKLGENAYRGIFSLVVVAALVLIVLGWRSATPSGIYVPPLPGGPITSILVFAAFVLFVSARSGSNIKRFVRHPQMLAVILWSSAHLLANGDSRSLVLFGGLGVWAVAEILLCNRRDGAWSRPDRVPTRVDVITVVIGAVAFALLGYLHEMLFGVAAG
jgi:uncharacterized membrane protein